MESCGYFEHVCVSEKEREYIRAGRHCGGGEGGVGSGYEMDSGRSASHCWGERRRVEGERVSK